MPKLSERGAIQFIILLILIIGIVAGVYLVQQIQIFKPKAGGGGPSQPIVPAVSLSVEAEFETGVDREVGVSVTARSDFDRANLFVAKLRFDPNLLRVNRIDTGTNFITNWAEVYKDDNIGEISLVGGVPSPGVQTDIGTSGHLATIYFQTLQAGTATISLAEDSAIYRDYDNSNIIGFRNGGTITILSDTGVPSPTPPSSSTSPTPTPSATAGSGDANGDGRIDFVDLSILFSDFNKRSGFRSGIDLNGDGVINTFDFSAMRNLLIQIGVIKANR